MYIRKTTKHYKGRNYYNYLLVESVATPKGPRQRIICSLGSLSPGPRQKWRELAKKVESALSGQLSLEGESPEVGLIVEKVEQEQPQRSKRPQTRGEMLPVLTEKVTLEEAREAGPAHVGHQMWLRLGVEQILQRAGLPPRARLLTEAMTLNRLISPSSERAMVGWMKRCALSDILGDDLKGREDTLYRHLDRLHSLRGQIESALAQKEKTLFSLDDQIYLYDLTSTYFEGSCTKNPQAQRGYSREGRPDAKQVVVGLVLDAEGFPKAHEIFQGGRGDSTTLSEMLTILEKRSGRREGATVVVDRGMATEENLSEIRARRHHYVVAARQSERGAWLSEFESSWADFEEVVRTPSPSNPYQKKSRVRIIRREKASEVLVLCLSQARAEKDRSIRASHEARLLADLERLKKRIDSGRLVRKEKVFEAIGRLKERYPRVARYYQVTYEAKTKTLEWQESQEKKRVAEELDGSYLLKTSRTDMSAEEIWRTYMLLTRVESAFRDMKSPLAERPIFHQLQKRVQTHIFLCVLAYHLLVAIEKTFLDQGIHTSWETLREKLSTHQTATVVLPSADGRTLRIRRGTTPEPEHREIYRVLNIPQEPMTPKRSWTREKDSDGREKIFPVQRVNSSSK